MYGSRLGGGFGPEILSDSGPAVASGGFAACPVALLPCFGAGAGWMREVYRLAYEQARAALVPTWYDRAARPSVN